MRLTIGLVIIAGIFLISRIGAVDASGSMKTETRPKGDKLSELECEDGVYIVVVERGVYVMCADSENSTARKAI